MLLKCDNNIGPQLGLIRCDNIVPLKSKRRASKRQKTGGSSTIAVLDVVFG